MMQRDLKWLAALPKRQANQENLGEGSMAIDPELTKKLAEKEIRKRLDPDYGLSESAKKVVAAEMEREAQAIRSQMEETGESPEDVAGKAATLVKEGVSPEEAVKLATEGKGVVVVKPGAGKSDAEKPKRRYSVLPSGEIEEDPDGDYETLTAAIIDAYKLRALTGPAFYYQEKDPETGEIKVKKAEGPVVIQQGGPAKVIQVTANGEVKEVEAGHPIIVERVVREGGSGAPPGTSKVIVVDSAKGTWQEQPASQPIIIVQQQPTPQTMLPLAGSNGTTLSLPVDQAIKYNESVQKMEQDKEKHKAIIDLFGVLKQELPRAIGAAEMMAKMGERKQQTPQTGKQAGELNVKEAAREMNIRQCPDCGTVFATPPGMMKVLCPNPDCPANKVE